MILRETCYAKFLYHWQTYGDTEQLKIRPALSGTGEKEWELVNMRNGKVQVIKIWYKNRTSHIVEIQH